MKRAITTKNATELAKALGLTEADGMEIEFRIQLNEKIIDIVKRKKITHKELAKLVKSSRPRMTSLLNRNIDNISTDLMLRVLAYLGYKAQLKVTRVA